MQPDVLNESRLFPPRALAAAASPAATTTSPSAMPPACRAWAARGGNDSRGDMGYRDRPNAERGRALPGPAIGDGMQRHDAAQCNVCCTMASHGEEPALLG